MKRIVLLLALIMAVTATQAQRNKKNPYLTQDTPEYEALTAKMIGEWNIASFETTDGEQIGSTYPEASFVVSELGENGSLIGTLTVAINQEAIDQRLNAWNKKGETVTVDSYKVIANIQMEISKKGDILYFENQENSVAITGEGEQLENFIQAENLYVSSQSSMKNAGGLGNLAGASLMKSVSGIDFVPVIPQQFNFEEVTDTSLKIFQATLKKSKMKLTLTK
jgi:hypothetical protein